MNDRKQLFVAVHRVVSHISPEDLRRLADLEDNCIRAGAHLGTGAQLSAHDKMTGAIGEILDSLDPFSQTEMAHYIREGYRQA